MSSKVWTIRGNTVLRYGLVVATTSKQEDGRLTWRGLGIERINCENEASVLADVKYFYRYPPCIRLKFKSGREVIL